MSIITNVLIFGFGITFLYQLEKLNDELRNIKLILTEMKIKNRK